MRYEVTIPGWQPPLKNSVLGRHWSAGHKAKARAAEMLFYCCLQAGVQKPQGRRRLSIRVTLTARQNQPDRDAFDMLFLDACSRAGIILDDSDRGLVGRLAVEFDSGKEKQTVIVIEDVQSCS